MMMGYREAKMRTGVPSTPALRSLSFLDLFISAWCCLKQNLQMIQFYQYLLEECESTV